MTKAVYEMTDKKTWDIYRSNRELTEARTYLEFIIVILASTCEFARVIISETIARPVP